MVVRVILVAVAIAGWWSANSHDSHALAAQVGSAPVEAKVVAAPADTLYADDPGYLIGRFVIPALIFVGVVAHILIALGVPQELWQRRPHVADARERWGNAR